MPFTFMALAAVVSACTHRVAEQPGSLADVPIEREDQQYELAANHRCVEVDNAYGDLHLRSGIEGKIAYHAVMQRIDLQLPRPQVMFETSGVCARVAVAIAGERPSAEQPWNMRRARVDLALALPPDLPVTARSFAGDIAARRTYNAIRALTVDGAIRLSGSGDFEAESVSGDIVLTASGQRSDRRWRAASTKGVIRVYLDDSSAAFSARTCAQVRSDFALASDPGASQQCPVWLAGDALASKRIMLRSERGNIEVFRLEP